MKMSIPERILLNQIAIMNALQLCLRHAPPLNQAEKAAIYQLEGLMKIARKDLESCPATMRQYG